MTQQMTTAAADRFTNAVLVSWDHVDCWARTAQDGLAEPDVNALRELCEEGGEDYETAEAEVLAFVREKVASRS